MADGPESGKGSLSRDHQMTHIRRVLAALGSRGGGVLLSFVFTLILARTVSPEVVGGYQVSLTLASILAAVASLGLGPAALQLLVADPPEERRRGIISMALLGPLLVGSVLGLAGIVLRHGIWVRFEGIPPQTWLPFVAVPLLALVRTLTEVYRAYGRTHLVKFSEDLFGVLTKIGLLVLLVSVLGRRDLDGVLLALIGSSVVVCVVLVRGLPRATELSAGPVSFSDGRRLMGISLPLMLNAVIWLLISWTDILMMGWLTDSHETGIYGVTAKVVTLVSVALVGAGVMVPAVAGRQFGAGDYAGFEASIRGASRWSASLGLVMASGMIILPGTVLGVFGDEYAVGGSSLLAILCVGQLVHVASGPSGIIVNILGKERRLVVANLCAAAVNVVLNLLLIPRLGAVGAAISTAIAYTLMNLLHGMIIYSTVGVLWIPNALWRVFGVGVISAAGFFALRSLVETPTVLQLMLVYLAVSLSMVLAATRQERTVITAFLRAPLSGRARR